MLKSSVTQRLLSRCCRTGSMTPPHTLMRPSMRPFAAMVSSSVWQHTSGLN